MPQSLKSRLSSHFRAQRDKLLREVLQQVSRDKKTVRILDIGGRTDYWQRVGYDFLRDIGARITIENITASEIDRTIDLPKGMFSFDVGDGRALKYEDNAFDVCHSNSVIEHVGTWRDMQRFAEETRRVAPSHYVQTPNFWFPVDPHFWSVPLNHWMPRPTRALLMRRLNLATVGRAKDLGHSYELVDSSLLLTRGQMQYLFPNSDIRSERLMLLTKSVIAVRMGQPG